MVQGFLKDCPNGILNLEEFQQLYIKVGGAQHSRAGWKVGGGARHSGGGPGRGGGRARHSGGGQGQQRGQGQAKGWAAARKLSLRPSPACPRLSSSPLVARLQFAQHAFRTFA